MVVWESESESRLVMSDSLCPHWLYSPWNSPGQNTGVGSLSLLQKIFPTQESNPSPSLQADSLPPEGSAELSWPEGEMLSECSHSSNPSDGVLLFPL